MLICLSNGGHSIRFVRRIGELLLTDATFEAFIISGQQMQVLSRRLEGGTHNGTKRSMPCYQTEPLGLPSNHYACARHQNKRPRNSYGHYH
jgi:hypothetical protein